MKRSLRLFNKAGKKPRRRQDIKDYDEEFEQEFEEDYYEDDEFEDEYGDEDYAEDEDYADDYGDEDYPEEDYPEDDYPEDKSYSRDKHGDFDRELKEDDDFDLGPRRQDADKVVPFPSEAVSDDVDYEDDDDEDPEFEEAYGDRADARYADEEDYRDDDDADYRDEEDDRYDDDADYRDEEDDRYDDDADYRDDDDDRYDDEDDYRAAEDDRYDADYRDEEDDRYEDDDRYYEEDQYADDYVDEEYDHYEDDYREDDEDYYIGAAAAAHGRRGGRDSAGSSRNSDKSRPGRNSARTNSSKSKSSRSRKSDKSASRSGNRRRRGGDGEGTGAKILAFIKNSSFAERAAVIVAILLVVGGVITMSFYSKALGRTAELNQFAEVGAQMQFDDVIGSSGLLAVADAERARAMTADMIEEEEEEEEEVADDAQGVTIKMTLTSIKSDMKIKFINSETNKLVANVPFNVSVVTPDGTTITYDDHDKDGIIYKNNLTAGKYKVTPVALPSEFSNYSLELKTQSLTIKDTVETKVVDVSNEIKKESQVNAAKEDTAVQEVIESALQDTVEWVDSNQGSSSSDGGESYEKVGKDTVANTYISAIVPSGSVRRLSASRTGNEGNEGDEIEPLKLDKTSTTIEVGQKDTIGITGNTDDLEFSTDNDGVAKASVSDNKVTIEGVAAGKANVTVTSKGGSETVKVEVKEPAPSQMSFDPTSVELKAGESKGIKAVGPDEVSCTSSDESKATVSASGSTITVTGVSEGTVKVTVKASGYEDATFNVTVKKGDPKDMSFSSDSVSIKEGETAIIEVKGPSEVKECTPKDSKIAKVETISGNKITVRGVKGGSETTFTVKADGYNDKTFKVTVTQPDKKNMKVSSAEQTLTLKPKDKKEFTVSDPSKFKEVVLEKGKEKILKVEKKGDNKFTIEVLETAKDKDTAKVIVRADNYNDYEITVNVSAAASGDIKLSASTITIVPGASYKLKAEVSSGTPEFTSSNEKVAKVDKKDGTITGVAKGETTIKINCTGYKEASVTVKVVDDAVLKDKEGRTLWVKDGDKYREAKISDYFNSNIKEFYIKKANDGAKYGWWTIDGKTYYFDKNGNKVTGEQVIKGARYTFGSDGVLSASSGVMGIDVSKWNGNIDWGKVKNSGVNFVIIRCGYRGSSAGSLIEDPKFRANIKGAQAAGLRVGVYFFSQAVNEVEAVEEASMCINLCKGYSLSFPIYIDVEGSNGRGDAISASQRTANIKAFCGTIQSAGYRAGVYSNKTWFTKNINTSSLTNYKIWLAQYAANVTYNATRYDMWQYTSKGSVSGISGNVDMNILYN